jgi:hypothetical protein
MMLKALFAFEFLLYLVIKYNVLVEENIAFKVKIDIPSLEFT